jgi:basic membrane protein A
VKAGELAQNQIGSGADVLTGSSQQAIGALTTVGDAKYRDQNIWWVGQDLAQLTTAEGKAKAIAASAYNYGAVIVGLVQKIDAGVKGGECIPLNFNNGGFIFEFNPALSAQATPEIKTKVDAALASMRASAGTIPWNSVDYSKL